MDRYTMLEDRGFVAVGGDDRLSFLQGLVSTGIGMLSATRAAYAELPAGGGHTVHRFFIVDQGDRLLLDCARACAGQLRRRLSLHRLGAKVALANVSPDYRVAACFGPTILGKLGLSRPGQARDYAGGIAHADPRLTVLGVRIVLHAGFGDDPLIALGCVRGASEDYVAHCQATVKTMSAWERMSA